MIVVLKWRSRTLARSGILSNSSCLVAKGLATVPEQAGATSPSNAQNIVISGDTTYSTSLLEAAKDCDILVHEFYSQKGWDARTPDWQRYHEAYHTSAIDLGKLAAAAKPKKLVLYHELPMGQPPEQVIREIREHFNGDVIYGKDLDVVR